MATNERRLTDNDLANIEAMLLLVEEVRWLRVELAACKARLPDGMKHCTILFKECEEGHGRLTATNWVQSDSSSAKVNECLVCQVVELTDELEKADNEIDHLKTLLTGSDETANTRSARTGSAKDVLIELHSLRTEMNEVKQLIKSLTSKRDDELPVGRGV